MKKRILAFFLGTLLLATLTLSSCSDQSDDWMDEDDDEEEEEKAETKPTASEKPNPGEGLIFELHPDGQSYIVTGIGTYNESDIAIPATHEGLPVTAIGKAAFNHYSSVTRVTLPDSITQIGEKAFQGCSALSNIVIPDSVTEIGDYAFFCCDSLTQIAIPENVCTIGDSAFRNLNSLASITVDEKNPVYHSANHCLIETATKTLLAGCKNSSIPTDGSVVEIEIGAFWGCTGLTHIFIPESVTQIGSFAFTNTDHLMSITVDAQNPVFHSANNCLIQTAKKELVVGCKNSSIPTDGSVTVIGWGAFDGCSGLTSLVIPDSVTVIKNYAFSDCIGLTDIVIPHSVTEIGGLAFSDCTALTDVVIPGSVTQIGNSAFSGCTALTRIVIPGSVTEIDSHMLAGCNNLADIHYSGTMEEWRNISQQCWLPATYTIHCTDGDIAK